MEQKNTRAEKSLLKKVKIKNPVKSKLLQDFKAFITRGNLIDLAVAVIIGAAFSAIITSLVNDIIMPLISAAVGKSLSDLIWVANGVEPYLEGGEVNPTAIILRYGNFIQVVINFFIIAIILFFIVKAYMSLINSYKNKYCGYTAKEYLQFIKEGKKRKEIKLMALQRDEEKKAKEELEKAEKEKDSVENILKDIRKILENQTQTSSKKNSPYKSKLDDIINK